MKNLVKIVSRNPALYHFKSQLLVLESPRCDLIPHHRHDDVLVVVNLRMVFFQPHFPLPEDKMIDNDGPHSYLLKRSLMITSSPGFNCCGGTQHTGFYNLDSSLQLSFCGLFVFMLLLDMYVLQQWLTQQSNRLKFEKDTI